MKRVKIQMTFSDGEDELFRKIVSLSPYNMSELVKQCLLHGYKNEKGRIETEDLAYYSEHVYSILNSCEKNLKKFSSYQVAELKPSVALIKSLSEEKYRAVERFRVRSCNQATKYLLEWQEGFYAISKNDPHKKRIAICLSENERNEIRELAKGVGVSDFIKRNIFSKCVGRIIIADGIDIDNETLATYENVLKNSDYFLFSRNVFNLIDYLNSINVPDAQKEIRKEARRLLEKS